MTVQTSRVAEQIPGITYRQLDYWTRRGFLEADSATPGSGRYRSYSQIEVLVATLMVRLIEAGFTVEAAHSIARDIAAGRPAMLGPGIEVVVRGPA
jgi:DNA-binding transcriptional MerR regulator